MFSVHLTLKKRLKESGHKLYSNHLKPLQAFRQIPIRTFLLTDNIKLIKAPVQASYW